jgi:hypothetical protein
MGYDRMSASGDGNGVTPWMRSSSVREVRSSAILSVGFGLKVLKVKVAGLQVDDGPARIIVIGMSREFQPGRPHYRPIAAPCGRWPNRPSAAPPGRPSSAATR